MKNLLFAFVFLISAQMVFCSDFFETGRQTEIIVNEFTDETSYVAIFCNIADLVDMTVGTIIVAKHPDGQIDVYVLEAPDILYKYLGGYPIILSSYNTDITYRFDQERAITVSGEISTDGTSMFFPRNAIRLFLNGFRKYNTLRIRVTTAQNTNMDITFSNIGAFVENLEDLGL